MAAMNWATIDPESRLYKGKNLFRWDDTPGLEHHCGTCATPLANPRAKTSCIGKHVEPCYRFHQQLHFVGKSHECFGCNSSDETHHIRHKEILRLVRQIEALDASLTGTPKGIATSNLTRRSSLTPTCTTSPTETSSDTFTSDMKATRRARKKTKKEGNGSARKFNAEVFQGYELDFISESIHLRVIESKGAWQGTYSYGKVRTSSGEVPSLVIDEELEVDGDAMEHTPDFGDTVDAKKLDEMTPRQRRVHTFARRKEGNQSRKYDPAILKKANSIYCGVDPEIFVRLGIEVVNPVVNSKSRKDLVAKLVAAIKEDLDIQLREDLECVMREEGFWRWAGKTALHHMEQTRREIDWATGQKITDNTENLMEDDPITPERVVIELKSEDLAVKDVLPVTVVSNLPILTVKTPVWTKTLRITVTASPSKSLYDTPSKRKLPRPAPAIIPQPSFVVQSCQRPHGKSITYSKMLQSGKSLLHSNENKENCLPDLWESGNKPAEGFFAEEEKDDEAGWSIVGSEKQGHLSKQKGVKKRTK